MSDAPKVPGFQSDAYSTDPAKNLPELPRTHDTPKVGTFNDLDHPTVAVIFNEGTPRETRHRLSLDDARWLGAELIAEAERSRFVHPSARRQARVVPPAEAQAMLAAASNPPGAKGGPHCPLCGVGPEPPAGLTQAFKTGKWPEGNDAS